MLRLCIVLLACCCLTTVTNAGNSGRKVVTRVENELPDFTIAREYDKHRRNYPFIRPISAAKSGPFHSHPNLVYRRIGDRELHLDLYRPGAADTPVPAVILVHGGGWRSGDRGHQIPMAQALAAAGYAGVTVEYRLSREALYPEGVFDIQAAVRWLRLHCTEYNIDPQRIAILGASSGAHMATLIGAVGHLPVFAGAATRESGVDSSLQAIINLDGVVDFVSPAARTHEDKPGKVSYAGLWLGGRYAQYPGLWREASPLHYAGPHTPPTLFINSAQPRFHVGRDEFMAILREHGIETAVHTLPDTPHSFWLFHPWFDTTRDLVTGFLDRVFRDRR